MSQAQFKGEAVTIGTPISDSSGLDLDLSGRQLGDYRFLRRLGRGAMADVYLAEQGSLRRQVAMKVLKRELAADELYVRRFDMEAQAAASLVQANIVQIYEVGCIEGWHYIAQEYVEGQNMSQFLQRHGTLDFKMALAVLRQVTAALCKAADRGIVHRDIKPENIMLAKNGEVKVADFGLARIDTGEETMKLTQVGITMGTPLYMSPEQVEGKPLDPRSDIYSLGVTCYHMLAGQPPFRGDTALSVALQHVRTQPARLENLRPDLPPALSRVIHKMLSKELAERYASPRDLLHELRALRVDGIDLQWPAELDELGGVETAALGTVSWAATQRLQIVMDHSRSRKSRRWLIFAAIAVLLALVIGAGLNLLLRGPFLLDEPAAVASGEEFMATTEAQFFYASSKNTEAAWRTLLEKFDDDGFYVPRAKEELALLYLNNGGNDDLQKGLALFQQLTKYPEVDKQYRANGLAGQAVVLALDQPPHPNKSMETLAELSNYLRKLPELSNFQGPGTIWNAPEARPIIDSRLSTMLDKVAAKNLDNLHAIGDKDPENATWKKLLENHSADETTPEKNDAPENHK